VVGVDRRTTRARPAQLCGLRTAPPRAAKCQAALPLPRSMLSPEPRPRQSRSVTSTSSRHPVRDSTEPSRPRGSPTALQTPCAQDHLCGVVPRRVNCPSRRRGRHDRWMQWSAQPGRERQRADAERERADGRVAARTARGITEHSARFPRNSHCQEAPQSSLHALHPDSPGRHSKK